MRQIQLILILFLGVILGGFVSCNSSKPSDNDIKAAEDQIKKKIDNSTVTPKLSDNKTPDFNQQNLNQKKSSEETKTTVSTDKTSSDKTVKTITPQDKTKSDLKNSDKNTVQKNTTTQVKDDTKKVIPSKDTTQKVATTDTKNQTQKDVTKNVVQTKELGQDKKERTIEDVVKEKEVYQYNSHNKRDPFINPYIVDTTEDTSVNLNQRKGQEDENVDFSKLNYRGLIQYGNELVAMLEDEAGRGLILKVGSVIGGAKVESISKDMVILKRFVITNEGQPREIILHKVTE